MRYLKQHTTNVICLAILYCILLATMLSSCSKENNDVNDEPIAQTKVLVVIAHENVLSQIRPEVDKAISDFCKEILNQSS